MHSSKMRAFCIFAIAGVCLALQSSESAEWMKVRLGDTVTLGCNMSLDVEVTWMRQCMDQVPTVVLVSGPKDPHGEAHSRHVLSARFTVVPHARDKTNQLRITNVAANDLALFYCVGRIHGKLRFGKGVRLHQVLDKEHDDSGHECLSQALEQGTFSLSNLPSPYVWFAATLGLGLIGMICAVFIVHLRSRGASNSEKCRAPPNAGRP